MGKIQKVQNQTQISVFEALLNEHVPLEEREPEMRTASSRDEERQELAREKRSEWEGDSVANRLAHNDPSEVDLTRRGNSIRSARCSSHGITNEGGSGKFVGHSKSQISMEDIQKIASQLSNKEMTENSKDSSNTLRAEKQAEYQSSHSPQIGDSEEGYFSQKGASIVSNHANRADRYKPGIGKISIFDNEDFERIPEREMETRTAQKDDSWKSPKRAFSSKDSMQRLVDGLGSENDSSYKSARANATDRIFEALINQSNKETGE